MANILEGVTFHFFTEFSRKQRLQSYFGKQEETIMIIWASERIVAGNQHGL